MQQFCACVSRDSSVYILLSRLLQSLTFSSCSSARERERERESQSVECVASSSAAEYATRVHAKFRTSFACLSHVCVAGSQGRERELENGTLHLHSRCTLLLLLSLTKPTVLESRPLILERERGARGLHALRDQRLERESAPVTLGEQLQWLQADRTARLQRSARHANAVTEGERETEGK